MKFKIGDRVEIRKDSEYYKEHGFHGRGEIALPYKTYREPGWVGVIFSDGYRNSYKEHDLLLLDSQNKDACLKITETALKNAYNKGCSTVKGALKSLFPEFKFVSGFTKDDFELYEVFNGVGIRFKNESSGHMCYITKEGKLHLENSVSVPFDLKLDGAGKIIVE